MIKKSLLTTLITFSLTGCGSTELIHADVGCMGQPQVSIGFTQKEADALTEPAKQKLVIFVKTLRARIDSQCKINIKHDLQYK
jgi:hypothetical protein